MFTKKQKVQKSACRCRGKFVAPGKFFLSPYSHNVANLNSSPNPNPDLNPTLNSDSNPNFNFILNFNSNPYCCMWNYFPVRRIFHYTGSKNLDLTPLRSHY